jgi:nucleoside-diphosphate-sugar epimerase
VDKSVIVLTGVNGFIGSNIAIYFLSNNYKVIGLVRSTSNLSRCKNFISDTNFTLLNYDSKNLTDVLKSQNNTVLIHTAWQGVTSQDRADWAIQFKNLEFGFKLLQLAKECSISKMIALGSQAEYGRFEGRVDENYICNPDTQYGFFKNLLSQMWSRYCDENKIKWYWLRLFSVYGMMEDENWFITNLIKRLQKNEDVELTAGEQKYDYLFVEDLAKNIESVINSAIDNLSGFYNLSSNEHIQLKEVACIIKELISSNGELLFGKIPYRQNQIMHMEGNSNKFKNKFKLLTSNMKLNISKMINK